MWNYEKRLEYPVNITTTNPKLAQLIISQYGGPDGEMGASMRYLSQRYSMPYRDVAGVLTDIGIEASEMFLKGKHLWKFLQPHSSTYAAAFLNTHQYVLCHSRSSYQAAAYKIHLHI